MAIPFIIGVIIRQTKMRVAQQKNILNRKIAPGIKDATEFQLQLPPYQKYLLKNGVEVFAINLGTLDTLMVNWIFQAGNGHEEKNLVAAAASALLRNGTTTRNAFQINEHFRSEERRVGK